MSEPCCCGRMPRGFYFMPPRSGPFDPGNSVACCSISCMRIAQKRRGQMNLNVDERRACEAASAEAGTYLETIGKTDLQTLTYQEWVGFLAHVYGTVAAEVRKIWEKDCPF